MVWDKKLQAQNKNSWRQCGPEQEQKGVDQERMEKKVTDDEWWWLMMKNEHDKWTWWRWCDENIRLIDASKAASRKQTFTFYTGNFYAQKKIQREVLTQRNFYTETFTQKYLYKENVYTQTGWHTHTKTFGNIYTKNIFYRRIFTYKNFYIGKKMHRTTFTHRWTRPGCPCRLERNLERYK